MNNITELQKTFPNISEIYRYSENNILYKIKIKDIINAKINRSIVNWYINRPADMTRCEEIRKYILDTYQQIEGMIYLSYNKDTTQFEIFDGLHRVTALCLIACDKLITHDCQGAFANVYDQEMLVNIRFNCSETDIMKVFKNINSSVSVPSVYMDCCFNKILIISTLSNEFQVKYKQHFTISKKPIMGNINVNDFTNLLDHLYDSKSNTIPKLQNKLKEINDNIKKTFQQK